MDQLWGNCMSTVNLSPGVPAHDGRDDRWLSTALLAAAVVALAYANLVSGSQVPPAPVAALGQVAPCLVTVFADRRIPPLTVALLCCLAALVLPRIRPVEAWGDRPAALVIVAGMVFQLYLILRMPLEAHVRLTDGADYPAFTAWLTLGCLVAAALVGAAVVGPDYIARAVVPPLLLTHILLGAWLIRHEMGNNTDVMVFQHDGIEALLHRQNPYSITYPVIIPVEFYGPGWIDSTGRLSVFPYPPLSLFLALPGQVLLGDLRYAQLAALTVAGALIASARPGRLATAAVGLLLFTPKIFHSLDQGWTEPFAVLLLAATLFCACRAPRGLPLALGLLLAVKQYLVFALPLTLLLLPAPIQWRDVWALWWRTALIALVVTLPLMIWDIRGFIADVVVAQFQQPFRLDSLSYLAVIARDCGRHPPLWLGFATLVPVTALGFWRAARTPAGFAAATAFLYLAFFAFSKQAFNNYYFFVLGALACAIAVARPPTLGRMVAAQPARSGVAPARGALAGGDNPRPPG